MRLSHAALAGLPAHVRKPQYDYRQQRCGIVHFGIGAFHRAHQAVFTDDAMAAGDRDWAITGVSLRSADVAEQMNPQDGLYTVEQRSDSGTMLRIIGSVQSVIVAPQYPLAVVEAIAAASTHIITLTITEKGYLRRPDGSLNLESADVANDLQGDSTPRTIYGYLAHGLAQRRELDRSGVTLVCCDNLAENGRNLQSLLDTFLTRVDTTLADWVRLHCRFPSTMVDRIVPAVTESDRASIESALGVRDAAAVVTEPFSQWVIEDCFAGPRPRWEAGGVQFVTDVRPFELAKLRILNGAHSALAYLGLLRGHTFVHQAIDDEFIRPIVERLMRLEAAATLSQEIDIPIYANTLLARFTNEALPHRLLQIAMDGSQKIPQRWLTSLATNRAVDRTCPALMEALAAWIVFIRGDVGAVNDPMANNFAELWRGNNPAHVVTALFGEGGVFSKVWQASTGDQQRLTSCVERLAGRGVLKF